MLQVGSVSNEKGNWSGSGGPKINVSDRIRILIPVLYMFFLQFLQVHRRHIKSGLEGAALTALIIELWLLTHIVSNQCIIFIIETHAFFSYSQILVRSLSTLTLSFRGRGGGCAVRPPPCCCFFPFLKKAKGSPYLKILFAADALYAFEG